MAKKFFVGKHSGEVVEVEARSLSGAMKKSGWAKEEIVSVSLVKPAPTRFCSLIEGGVKVVLEGGAEMSGEVEQINEAFKAMGYGAIKVRVNLMSQKPYVEAAGTPGYCSPASEAYWSM